MRTISRREAEVLALLGDHLTHAEIAARLVISIRTVETHVAALRRKLELPAHRDLVRYAAARGGAEKPGGALRASAAPLSSFVGRERERAELADAVRESRVVSVIGPGGAGKTRLARAVGTDLAADFAAEVWLVDLVPVADGAALPHAVALAAGMADLPGRDVEDALVRGLSGRPALLVLDNCEHLVDAVALLVERLVSACGELHVLLTSRLRLAVPFEHVYPLAGLSPPGAARELFVQRARSAGWGHPTAEQSARIDDVCRALAGLPLAIELAAVRLPSLGLGGVERGLADHRQLLTGRPRSDPRQGSMHDTLEWSYRLLGSLERAVLCRTAVFPAGFDVDAARAVAGFGTVAPEEIPQALAGLVDHSLLVPEPNSVDQRWRMLEPIRQFGRAQMSDADRTAVAAHVVWVRGRAAGLLTASREPGRGWQGEFDEVAEDLRTALNAVARQANRQEEACELADALATLLFRAGRVRESQARYQQAAELAQRPSDAIGYLMQAAAVAKCRVLGEEALRLELAAVDAARAAGDRTALAQTLAAAAETIVRFEGMFAGPAPESTAVELLTELSNLSYADPLMRTTARVIKASRADPFDPRCRADAELAANTAHRLGDPIRESAALDVLTGIHVVSGRPVQAACCARSRVELLLRRPVEPTAALELKDALHMGVLTGTGAGELAAASAFGEQHATLPFLREQRDLAIEPTLLPDALTGRWAAVLTNGELFLEDWIAAGRHPAPGRAIGPCAVAMTYGLVGRDADRERWLRVVAEIRGVDRPAATDGTGYGELFEAILMLDRGRPSDALTLLTGETRGQSGWYGPLLAQWRAALRAEAAVLAAHPAAPRHCLAAEDASAGNPIATALAERARAIVADDADALIHLASRFGDLGASYQQARTLTFTAGSYRSRGERLIQQLRAAHC